MKVMKIGPTLVSAVALCSSLFLDATSNANDCDPLDLGLFMNPLNVEPNTYFHTFVASDGSVHWRPGRDKIPGSSIDYVGIPPKFINGTPIPGSMTGAPNGGHTSLELISSPFRPTRPESYGGFMIDGNGNITFHYTSNGNFPEHGVRTLTGEAREKFENAVRNALSQYNQADPLFHSTRATPCGSRVRCRGGEVGIPGAFPMTAGAAATGFSLHVFFGVPAGIAAGDRYAQNNTACAISPRADGLIESLVLPIWGICPAEMGERNDGWNYSYNPARGPVWMPEDQWEFLAGAAHTANTVQETLHWWIDAGSGLIPERDTPTSNFGTVPTPGTYYVRPDGSLCFTDERGYQRCY